MMDRLYILIIKSKSKDKNAMLAILQQFEPSFKKSLTQTSYNNRDDLYQDLKLKVLEAIEKYDLNSCPGFWDFIGLYIEQ